MDVKRAAENTLTLWRKGNSNEWPQTAERAPDGHDYPHQRWLLETVMYGGVEGEKAHRWLSYAQGYLVAHKVLTLDQCKHANLLS